MTDIELVIKIPEEVMEYIKNNDCLSVIYNDEVAKAIANGIPLPKGHGDLIDRDEILQGEHFVVLGDVKAGDKNFGEREIDMFPKQTIMSIKPVIEADKEYELKAITRGNCMMCGKELTEGLFFCKECETKQIAELKGDKQWLVKWQKLKGFLTDGKEHITKDFYVSRPSVFEEILDIMEELEKKRVI